MEFMDDTRLFPSSILSCGNAAIEFPSINLLHDEARLFPSIILSPGDAVFSLTASVDAAMYLSSSLFAAAFRFGQDSDRSLPSAAPVDVVLPIGFAERRFNLALLALLAVYRLVPSLAFGSRSTDVAGCCALSLIN